MAFEQFKTQVLLLHGEQRTLDALSAGFNDRFELHCATTGSEALNTLGVTPVDIIVSAQKLPGMSGLDALREAKKRSPKTITILLAGTEADDGLEALVSDKEIFQVVRGDLTPERLMSIVDNATRTARLMALSESANDTSADVDEPKGDHEDTGEHIVMETGDNGSFVISDGTGQVPVLKPAEAGTSPARGSRNVDLLVLTRDDEFLGTVRQTSAGTHKIHHAVSPEQAEDFVRNFPVGVLISDAALAGSSVEAMTQRIRQHQKRLVSIVAGRRDDGEMLMDLINRGQVYRFLLKPVSPGRARLAIEASIKHHLDAPEHAFKGRPAASKPSLPPARPGGKAQAPVLTPLRDAAAAKPPAKKPGPARPAESLTTKKPATDTADGIRKTGDDGSHFAETMTGIVASFGKALSRPADSPAKPLPKAEASTGAPVSEEKPAETPTKVSVPPQGDRRKPSEAGGGSRVNVKVIGIAAAVLAVAGVGFMMLGGEDVPVAEPAAEPTSKESTEPAVAEETTVDSPSPRPEKAAGPATLASEPEASKPAGGDAEALLEEARSALAAGDAYSPPGRNAVELYVAARNAAPGDAAVATELENVIEEVFGRAEAALLDGRTAEAGLALRAIGVADPDNPRLNFLRTQLDRQELGATLEEARVAVRESRFEDAGQLLARAESLAGADTAELDALSAELARARSMQQLDEVLALAGERLEDNRLVSPRNDSARYYFQLARTIDPDSSAARQGLTAVAGKLVLSARTAIDAGNLDLAAALLADAKTLDADSDELAAAEKALAAARRPEPPAPKPDPVPAAKSPAPDSAPAPAAESSTTEPSPAAAEPETGDNAEADTVAATPQAKSDAAEEVVSITAVKRTKYVPPIYPRPAVRRNITGHVDVAFTVTITGAVADVEVREADPVDVFEDAAIKAVEQWEFEPAFEDGVAVPKRVAVRMSFNLQ